MYIYIYTHTYRQVCMYVYICVYIYVHTCIYVYVFALLKKGYRFLVGISHTISEDDGGTNLFKERKRKGKGKHEERKRKGQA